MNRRNFLALGCGVLVAAVVPAGAFAAALDHGTGDLWVRTATGLERMLPRPWPGLICHYSLDGNLVWAREPEKWPATMRGLEN